MEKDLNRSQIAALKAYPNVEQPVWDESYPKTLFVRHTERDAFIKGYEQAEKDTIKRVIDWVRKNAYIYTDTQNDEEGNLMTVFLEKAFIDDLKKAMEEE